MKTNTANMLKNFLESIANECTGKLGYAVARNIRLLSTELTEYNDRRNELIRKYGVENDGVISVENGSEGFYKLMEEMKEYEDIEINIELMKVSEDTLSNSNISADKMLVLMDYMVE